MNTETVPIDILQAPARNVRVHPDKQIVELARAIEKFGQIRPVVIDEKNTILAGNGLVAACRKLGWREIAVQRMTGLTEADKKKLMLSDNKVFALGLDDHGAILDTIRELDDFDIPGFDPDVLQNLSLDSSAVSETALSEYGTMSDEAVAGAQGRQIEPGSTEPQMDAVGSADNGEEEPNGSAALVRCPECGHRFTPE